MAAGPAGLKQRNDFTGETCQGAEASEVNQRRVLLGTLAKLDTLGLCGVLFKSFGEGSWKIRKEGAEGSILGVWHGVSPFDCKSLISSSLDFDGNGKTDVGVYRSAGVVHKVVVR